MKPIMWNFKKEDGKWKSEINPEYVFFMYSTFGFPYELLIEIIKGWDRDKLINSKLHSWITCNETVKC